MGWSQIIAGVSVFLTGLLPAGCHKAAATPPKASPAIVIVSPTSTPQHDLGEVALTNHVDTCLQLSGGRECTFTPHMIDSHTVEITVSLESRTPAGKIHDVFLTQVTAKNGKPMEVALGGYQLSLTPNISE